MSRRPRDRAERLLGFATTGLPAHRREWGGAMRAELAAIEEPTARRVFARGAARTAFWQGLGLRLGLVLAAGLTVGVACLAGSRLQLPQGGPGLLSVTVPVPAAVLLSVSAIAATRTRSLRIGLETAAASFLACSAAALLVVAVEGTVWMDRVGVFILDADPPKGSVEMWDVVVNPFTSGMWVGHVILWVPAAVTGAALGAWLSTRWRRLGAAPA